MALDKFIPTAPEQEDIKKTKTVDLQKDEPGFKGKNIYEIRNKVEKMNKAEAKEFLKLWIDIGKKRNEINGSRDELFMTEPNNIKFSLYNGLYQVYQGDTLTIKINHTKIFNDGSGSSYRLKIHLTNDGSIFINGDRFSRISTEMEKQSNGRYSASSLQKINKKMESVEAIELITELTSDFTELAKDKSSSLDRLLSN